MGDSGTAGGTNAGTISLKACARLVLQRDKARDNKSDMAACLPSTAVPLTGYVTDARGTLAAALLAAAERDAAAVADGPADDIEAAEAETMRALAAQPARRPGEGHREHVQALARA